MLKSEISSAKEKQKALQLEKDALYSASIRRIVGIVNRANYLDESQKIKLLEEIVNE